jgi:CHAD domain-containing protein
MQVYNNSIEMIACKYLKKHLAGLRRHIRRAKSVRDTVHVHQSRVASRRLRSGLKVCQDSFSTQSLKRWRKTLQRITKKLGPARDKDVLIDCLDTIMMDLTEDQKHLWPGIKRLHIRLIQGRQKLQPKVIKVIDELEKSNVLVRMAENLEKKRLALKTSHTSLPSSQIVVQAKEYLGKRVCQCQAWTDSLNASDDIEGHHRLRIAIKKMRYSLEIFAPLFAGQLDPYVTQVKQWQTLLGDIHDCDVWSDQIDNFMTQEYDRTVFYFGFDGPFRQLRPGLDYLKQHWTQQRRSLFQDLLAYWQSLSEDRFWESLMLTLEEPDKTEIKPQDDVTTRVSYSADGKTEIH